MVFLLIVLPSFQGILCAMLANDSNRQCKHTLYDYLFKIEAIALLPWTATNRRWNYPWPRHSVSCRIAFQADFNCKSGTASWTSASLEEPLFLGQHCRWLCLFLALPLLRQLSPPGRQCQHTILPYLPTAACSIDAFFCLTYLQMVWIKLNSHCRLRRGLDAKKCGWNSISNTDNLRSQLLCSMVPRAAPFLSGDKA